MDIDISSPRFIDIHVKSVDIDINAKFHIHGNGGNFVCVSLCESL